MKKPIKEWPIIRTIVGKNSAGKKLHKVLPFKKPREVVGEIIRGVADLSPVPNAKDASIREKAQKVKDRLESVRSRDTKKEMYNTIKDIYDLLDDGVLNDSAELDPSTRKKIRLATSFTFFGLVVYEVLAIAFGWPSVLGYVTLVLAGV